MDYNLEDQQKQDPGFWGGLLQSAGTPMGQGLLSAAFAGLASAGKKRPLNLLGTVGQAGLLGYSQAEENQNAQSLKNIQLQTAKAGLDKMKKVQDLQQRFATPAAGNAMGATAAQGNVVGGFDAQGNYTPPLNNLGPTRSALTALPSAKPTFDYGGYADALAAIDPTAALSIKTSLQKDTPFNKLDPKDFEPGSLAKFAQTQNYGDLIPRGKKELSPGGQVWDPYATPTGAVMPDPNKPFTIGPNGQLVPNTPYQRYQLSKAKAGAPSTNVRVENKMGDGLAAQVGPMVKAGYDGAQGALQQADAADRITRALDSNKVLAGPGASLLMYGLQLGQTLGVGGRNSAEILDNTRATVRGLAEFSLNSRKSLAGQGQITENEQKLLDRAVSGDIDSLTPGEIRQIVSTTRRQAQKVYQAHQSNVNRLRQSPGLNGLADYYALPEFPQQGGGEINFGDLQ
jgi:hypothetical protein